MGQGARVDSRCWSIVVDIGGESSLLGSFASGVNLLAALASVASLSLCQDQFSSTILLGGPWMQGTNEEVSPDTSRC